MGVKADFCREGLAYCPKLRSESGGSADGSGPEGEANIPYSSPLAVEGFAQYVG